jgi:hypothetical protein
MSAALIVWTNLSETAAGGREVRTTGGGGSRSPQGRGSEPRATPEPSRGTAPSGDHPLPSNYAIAFPKLVLHG